MTNDQWNLSNLSRQSKQKDSGIRLILLQLQQKGQACGTSADNSVSSGPREQISEPVEEEIDGIADPAEP